MVGQDLLEILRCPACVRDGPEAGLLDHSGNWLICRDCDRKYPIRDDIPVMLIEEGDRFRELPRPELPEVPPPEERKPVVPQELAPAPACPLSSLDERQKLALALVGAALGLGLVVLLVALLRKKGE